MLPVAMRSGVVGLLPGNPAEITEAHARRVRELGFTGASVMLMDPADVPHAALRQAHRILADQGIRVAQANARYPALVSVDATGRSEGVRLAQAACRAARLLDPVYLLIRPGGLNPGGDWRPHRDNHTPETQDRLVDSLRQVCQVAESEGVTIGLECHAISPLDSPERVRTVLAAVNSPVLRYNADPVNFITSFQDAYHSTELLEHIFAVLGPHVISAHVKDARLGDRLVIHIDECAPGEGIFDLATFMRLFDHYLPDGYALIEHLPDEKIPAAKQALDEVVASAGLSWTV